MAKDERSGAKADPDMSVDGWICEAHPEFGWPHGDCAGPGMLECARIEALVYQRDLARGQRDALLTALKGARPLVESETARWVAEALASRDESTEGKLDGARSLLDDVDAAIALAEAQ